MPSFGEKNVKTHFFNNNYLLTKVSTSSVCACEQVGTPHNKTLKIFRFLKKRNFYDFLKNRNFQKLTTDFENRIKRAAETKSCVCLDVDQ